MTRRLTRAEQTARTTERVYSALLEEIRDRGWDGVVISGIAKRAGVTVGAIYTRAESASELANLLWSDQLVDRFRLMIQMLVDAARSGSIEEFTAAARTFDEYSRENSIVFDLAIASLFDDELGEVVQRDITEILTAHIRSGEHGPATPVHSAATTLLLCFFMGRALAIRAMGHAHALTRTQLEVIAGYWAAPEKYVDVAEVVPVAFVRREEDSRLADASLFHGVVEVLSRWGYRRATIARIARAAGLSPGAVLASHGTKASLVSAAASALVYSPAEVWQQYAPVVTSLGPLKARAAFLATFLDPQHAKYWKLNIELARVAEFTPELGSFKTPDNTLEHTHLGVMFVACFVEGLRDLPFAGSFTVGSAT